MAKQTFVALGQIKHGAPDGTIYHLSAGDPLPDVMTDEEVLQLRASGAAAPKAVHDAMVAADKAQAEADRAKAEAESELAAVGLRALDAQAEAERALADEVAEASPTPTASAPVSQPKAQTTVVSSPKK